MFYKINQTNNVQPPRWKNLNVKICSVLMMLFFTFNFTPLVAKSIYLDTNRANIEEQKSNHKIWVSIENSNDRLSNLFLENEGDPRNKNPKKTKKIIIDESRRSNDEPSTRGINMLDNPNWNISANNCVPNALLHPGVAVVTTSMDGSVALDDRHVISYISMNNTLGAGRTNSTDLDSVLHHSDWLVQNIGNVYGIAIKQSTAEVFVTASSNYGAGYFGPTSAFLNYGTFGSPTAVEAAGTIYRIHPTTGEVTVFSRLPQLSTTLEHWDCEQDAQEITRTNTGVGLGNVVYDFVNDQFFVTNIEDGRIYRLNSSGTILDSYDPLIMDTGTPGIDDLEDIPYGIAIEPGSNRLFFGTVDDPGPGAVVGTPAIYSIDLNASGGFVGTVDNTVLPAGVPNNYVGSETFHTTISAGGGSSFTTHTIYLISDLTFVPNGDLLVGVRVGCHGSWYSSYNHWGETDIITLNTTNNLYDNTPFEYDISVSGSAGNEDGYGGVAFYDLRNGSCDVQYAASYADLIGEVGPHGVSIWDQATTNAPLSPMASFSYGLMDVDASGNNQDAKGVGGDVEMFNGCALTCDITGATETCGENVSFTINICPQSNYEWQVVNGDATIVGSANEATVEVAPGSGDFTIRLTDEFVTFPCEVDVTLVTIEPGIDPAGPFCETQSSVNLSGFPAGGTWTGTGITDGVNGTFDPSTAGSGNHTITYTVTQGSCTEFTTIDLQVNNVTDLVTTTTPTSICSTDESGPVSLDLATLLTPNTTSGTWADTDASGGLVGSIFTASSANKGNTYTFTYTITGAGPGGTDCADQSFTLEVEVLDCDLDAALIKTLNTTLTTLPVSLNATITYDIQICNQGGTIIDSIEVTDYIPTGYNFTANNNWVLAGNGIDAVILMTVGNGLLPGVGLGLSECITIPIELELVSSNPSELVNYAEITLINDVNGRTDDIDSTPGSDSAGENNINPGDPDDNNLLGGGPGAGEDEDDHDPATVPVVDIALAKKVSTAGPYGYGTEVRFDIEVTNQGNVDLSDIVVTDYVPCGFSLASTINNGNWTVSGLDTYTHLVFDLIAGATTTIYIDLVVEHIEGACVHADAYTNYAEVSYMEGDLDNDGTPEDVSGSDIDSNSDGDNTNDLGGDPMSPADDYIDGDGTGTIGDGVANTDEDDHDPSKIPVFDLALDKKLVTTGPYAFGNVVSFDITVYNQGSVDAVNVELTDYIPVGYSYDPTSTNNTGVWTNTVVAAGASGMVSTIIPSIVAGGNAVVRIDLQIEVGQTTDWNNYAEISDASDPMGNNTTLGTLVDVDSTPDNINNENVDVVPGDPNDDNVNGGGPGAGEDEDDHDPASVPVVDIALAKKVSTAGPYGYGTEVRFDIEVTNQGNVDLSGIVVTDYVPCGFSLASTINNGNWAVSGADTYTHLGFDLIAGATTTIYIDLVVEHIEGACVHANAYTNYAEVSYMEGDLDDDGTPEDVSGSDIDSNSDGDNTNDLGGDPMSPADDYINGNGTGTVGDGVANTDEDDHDPSKIPVFDLALDKKIVTALPYTFGDILTFEITVYNQGSVEGVNVEVTDYIPTGYSYDPTSANNTGVWTNTVIAAGASGQVSATIPSILPGANVVLSIDLVLEKGKNHDWDNYGEISYSEDPMGNNTTAGTLVDADSTPDQNNGESSDVTPGSTDDNNVNGEGPSSGEDEDDHDPAAPVIFDLSLFKTVITPGPYNIGQEISFQIGVINQGNVSSVDYQLVDYIPSGFAYAASNNALGWMYTLGESKTYLNITDELIAGDTAFFTINLVIQKASDKDYENAWNNYAEIAAATGVLGVEVDLDSTPNDSNDDDGGANAESPTDDYVDGEGSGTPGSEIPIEDEDDHDIALVEIHDVALIKTLPVNQPTVSVGDVVTFTMVVVNQGNHALNSVELIDYINDGYDFVPNNNWTASGDNAVLVATTGNSLLPISGLAIGDSISFPLDLSIAVGANISNILNIAEITASLDDAGLDGDDDIDSNPNADSTDDGGGAVDTPSDDVIDGDGSGTPGSTDPLTDEDDHDAAEIVLTLHSIGNQVWNDVNNNGQIDTDEPLLQGVEVILYYINPITLIESVVGTEVTDVNGQYLFDTLNQGSYIIEIPATNFASGSVLEHFTSSTGNGVSDLSNGLYEDITNQIDPNNDANVDDNGVLNGNNIFPIGSIASETIVLGGSEPLLEGNNSNDSDNDGSGALDENSNLTVDFGFVLLHSIGNQIWEDANNNGIYDASESPLPGVEVILHYVDPISLDCIVVETTVTNGSGLYLFDSLIVGDYIVEIPATNFGSGAIAEGYVSSTGAGVLDLNMGVYEDASNPIDPDNNVDLDDNGVEDGNTMFPVGSIASDTISLGANEPLTESQNNDTSGAANSNSNLTVDFGLVPLHSIGNQVWIDDDNSGIKEAGELPLEGVEVVLHYVDPISSNCIIVTTTTTDVNGQYLFDHLIAGEYLVEIPASNFVDGAVADGYVSSTGSGYGAIESGIYEDASNPINPNNDTNVDDNGVLDGNAMFVGSIVSDTILLSTVEPTSEGAIFVDSDNDNSGALDNNSNLTIDFGLTPIYSIGNTVWLDSNSDGWYNIGEEIGIGGVLVELHYYDPSTGSCIVVATTTTDVNGQYLFDLLTEGAYIVMIPSSELVPGGVLEDYQSTSGTFNAGGIFEDINNPIDGDSPTDHDDNGVTNLNPNFPGAVSSDTIRLSAFGEPINESINNDNSGALDNNSNLTIDFGFVEKVMDLALRKTVVDRGPISPGGTAEFIITVFNQGNVYAENIVVKDYINRGYTYDAGENLGWTLIGETAETTINGQLAPGDSAKVYLNLTVIVPDAPVLVPDWFNYGEIGSAVDTFGVNRDDIDSNPSSNTAEELANYPDGPDDNVIDEGGPNVGEDEDDHDVDYVLVIGWLAGVEWKDLDGNGIQDPNEPVVPGLNVELLDCDGNLLDFTVTDENGEYIFNYLIPGEYVVHIEIPEACEPTFKDVGSNDDIDSDFNPDGYSDCVVVPAGDTVFVDEGSYECIPIGELVWYDVNQNDLWDPTENGLNGLKVNLWRYHLGIWIIWDVEFTGHKPGTPSDDGYYNFCAPPGSYYVEVVIPPQGLVPTIKNINGYISLTNDNEQTNDSDVNSYGKTNIFTVYSGDNVTNIGAGYYPMAAVAGKVWNDTNENGIQDSNESKAEGVVIKAFNEEGENVGEAISDEDGEYMIDYLQRDGYYLQMTPPNGYGFAPANEGGDDSMDSDIDHSNGSNTTTVYQFEPNDMMLNVDAGLSFGVLPVKWNMVKAENRGDHNHIVWSTSSEINTDYFEVEVRYQEDKSFTMVGRQDANGNSNELQSYSIRDFEINRSGIYFYRVKSVDNDGKVDYSIEVSVRIGELSKSNISIYPNPTVSDVHVAYEMERDGQILISIQEINGAVINKVLIDEHREAGNHTELIKFDNYPDGVYLLRIDNNGTVYSKQLIIMKN